MMLPHKMLSMVQVLRFLSTFSGSCVNVHVSQMVPDVWRCPLLLPQLRWDMECPQSKPVAPCSHVTLWFAYGDIQPLSPVSPPWLTNREWEQKGGFHSQIGSEGSPIKQRLSRPPARLRSSSSWITRGRRDPLPALFLEGSATTSLWLHSNELNHSCCLLENMELRRDAVFTWARQYLNTWDSLYSPQISTLWNT